MCHCESVDSGLLDTTVESFDRHYAVNVRASWQLLKEYAERFPSAHVGAGRVVALTSDHVVGNLPYGATQGRPGPAGDRRGPRAVAPPRQRQRRQPGAGRHRVDVRRAARERPRGRPPSAAAGRPQDTAALVSFLLSAEGGWVNGQLLSSDGGLHV